MTKVQFQGEGIIKGLTMLNRRVQFLICLMGITVSLSCIGSEESSSGQKPVPSHADAAVIFAKHTGLFDAYVKEDASLSECVAFLNKNGIYFGLLEIVNGAEFTLSDCARVMGQIELVLLGEAEYISGKVKLPKNIDSWEDYCTMSQVNYIEGYQTIVEVLLFEGGLSR